MLLPTLSTVLSAPLAIHLASGTTPVEVVLLISGGGAVVFGSILLLVRARLRSRHHE